MVCLEQYGSFLCRARLRDDSYKPHLFVIFLFLKPPRLSGKHVPNTSNEQAFLNSRKREKDNLDLSETFLTRIYRWPVKKPPADLWEAIANLIFDSKAANAVLRINLIQARSKSGWLLAEPEFAYAHRSADGLVEIIGNKRVKNIVEIIDKKMKPWLSGIYPGTGEEGLKDKNYLYWGSSLPRLINLRRKLDPKSVFENKLGLPDSVSCPGKLKVLGDGNERLVSLDVGYTHGQLSGMRCEFSASGRGCGTVEILDNAVIKGTNRGVYGIIFDGSGPARVRIEGGPCEFKVKTINGISC